MLKIVCRNRQHLVGNQSLGKMQKSSANVKDLDTPLHRIAKGGRLARPYALFTYVASIAAGVGVFLIIPEVDEHGRDHVFSGVKRYIEKKKDEFFEITPEDYMDVENNREK